MAKINVDPRKKYKYNPLCRVFFCWLEPLFCIGFRRTINHSELYPHPPESSSQYLYNKFIRYWSGELAHRGDNARLWLVLLKCFWWRLLLSQSLTLILVGVYVAQSEVLGLLTQYFSLVDPSPSQTNLSFVFAVILSFLGFSLIFINLLFYVGRKTGGLIRIILTIAIYSKVFSLSQMTLSDITMGHVINIASNDVYRFNEDVFYLPFLLACPVHVVIVSSIVYQELSWSAFLIVGLLVILVPVLVGSSIAYSKLRFKAARVTDRRVKVMNEIIIGMRVIKMYGWEYAFSQLINRIRRKEILLIVASSIVRSLSGSFGLRFSSITLCFVFTAFTATGGQLSPGIVFSTLSHITFVQHTAIHFVIAVLFAFEAYVGYKRIKAFLLLPELFQSLISNDGGVRDEDHFALATLKQETHDEHEEDTTVISNMNSIEVIVERLTSSWLMDATKPTLQDISFTVGTKGSGNPSLVAIVGHVGSGKSTLLQCILKELPSLSGSVTVNGTIGYASQEAVVFSATLRENILFGLPYEEEWYQSVIVACALNKDIELLPDGDMTLVGERGVTLSGGQKARVNLARAVYRDADVYLLDDPLSAVDAAVGRHIFDKCVLGLLADKCVVLVTHQLQYLPHCDCVLKLKEGRVVANDDTILQVQDYNENLDTFVGELSSSDVHLDEDYTDVNTTVDLVGNLTINDNSKEQEPVLFSVISEEERAHGTVSLKTYYRYFKAGGGFVLTGFVLGIITLTAVFQVITDWWIADWSICFTDLNDTSYSCTLTTSQHIGVYVSLTSGLVVVSCVESVIVYIVLVRSSQVLHNKMFSHVLRAPVYFFDTNPVGQILNRFSKDIGFMDDILVQKFFAFFVVLAKCSFIFLLAVIANYYLIVLMLILCVIFFAIRLYYLRTARDIKRLEAIARSPIYSHLSLTLQGLATIRSYSMQSVMMEQMHHFQNKNSQAWYLFISTSRWLSMRLDSLVVLFMTVALLTAVPLANSLDPALVSLSLAYVISLSDIFAFLLRTSTEVENLMVSPERVLAYGELTIEGSLETNPHSSQLPPNWPDKGQIIMNGVSYSHSSNGPTVLCDISCTVPSGHKVGIVGRTGAGKSSLVSALFRLAQLKCGSIIIDGIDIGSIGLHDLRKKLSIIPQDPVLFGGTVRYNLDPFESYSDSEIWTALQQVQMKVPIEALEGQLEAMVSEGGTNFSVGQRQLFCLARALLRKNSILILDEATANVDLKTDAIIQEVIRDKFSQCTLLTIAHRLHTVMDYDWIMVMDKGQLVEYDAPHILLSQSSSYLSQLVEQTGLITANKLKTIAFKNYNEKMKEK